MTLHKYIEAWIAFPDTNEEKFTISEEMREFLENHQNDDDVYEEDDLLAVDIDENVVKEMEKVSKFDNDKRLIKEIKEHKHDWMNIDIHIIYG